MVEYAEEVKLELSSEQGGCERSNLCEKWAGMCGRGQTTEKVVADKLSDRREFVTAWMVRS